MKGFRAPPSRHGPSNDENPLHGDDEWVGKGWAHWLTSILTRVVCELAAYWRVSSAVCCGILQEMSVEDFGAQQKFTEALSGICPFAVESRPAQFLKDAAEPRHILSKSARARVRDTAAA